MKLSTYFLQTLALVALLIMPSIAPAFAGGFPAGALGGITDSTAALQNPYYNYQMEQMLQIQRQQLQLQRMQMLYRNQPRFAPPRNGYIPN